MVKTSLQAFNWKDSQGEFVQNNIAEGKMPPNPTKDQYKAVYDASDGDVLKFQNFHSSWKNVSHNLATSNAVIRSTGIQQAAAIEMVLVVLVVREVLWLLLNPT